MNRRQAAIAGLVLAGLLAGSALPRAWAGAPADLPGYGYLLLAVGLAIGVPVALGSVGTSGAYGTVVRLWSGLGALAILLACAGLGVAGRAALDAGSSPLAWLLLAGGTGLLAGLGIVKLAIRHASAQRRG